MKISINTAEKQDLLLLPGINLSEAEAIMRERDRNTGFATTDEFMIYVAKLDVPPHLYKAIENRIEVTSVRSGAARVIDF
ncbi:ComEA family DNA-binding protein [Selenomonas ruminantium]|uniref:ComEA family DNA-binding protein n=1 Tax=Selenomonas ruminantium TaxID=971 RepID=UPI00047BF11E|nr:helix-hairpin-helix domain-containing protein [Selenomonas ruminantium]